MERKVVNPWSWQDEFGYVQCNVVEGAQRVAYLSGQTSVDANGAPMHAGNMRAQIELAVENLKTVLEASGFSLADVIRLNIYTTDVDAFFESYDAIITPLAEGGCRFAGSLIGVSRLAFPELMVEIEATAAS